MLFFIIILFFVFFNIEWFTKLFKFIYYKFYDFKNYKKNGKQFNLYGLRLFTGRQGSGKSTTLVYLLDLYKRKYPKAKIYTNFGYSCQNANFSSWKDLLDPDFLNGEDGVIIGWDEIQNDFASTDFKNIPEGFLRQITQQRKQRICILGTSQVYTRVLKALREQCFEVSECKTYFGRWTTCKTWDADIYEHRDTVTDPKQKFKLRKKRKFSFIQTNKLREKFNSYQLIESMSNKKYIPLSERLTLDR
jgi:ATP-dependent Clp protease ATP-binding subunit ClpX